MSLASSHFELTQAHAVDFLGGSVSVMRPFDVAYSPATGIVGNERTESREAEGGGIDQVRVRDVAIAADKLPGASARIDLLWTIDGDQYATEDFTRIAGGMVSFALIRVDSLERTRKGYRGGR